HYRIRLLPQVITPNLTYPLKRARHALPALGPGHVTPKQIPLGPPPFLHHLPWPQARPRSAASQVLWSCPTSCACASSACVLRLPDASALWRKTQDLPVPAQGAYVHAQGLRPRGVQKRLAISTPPVLPSDYFDSVGTPEWPPLARWGFNFTAQYLAYTYPCQRFTCALADADA